MIEFSEQKISDVIDLFSLKLPFLETDRGSKSHQCSQKKK